MIGLVMAAPRSGSGKTILTMALLALLQQKGLRPCAFKCGPDYIDPGFHRAVLGVECRNLDLYLSSADTVQALYACGAAGCGAVVAEGAMGYYDGVGGTPQASAWQVGQTLGLPALMVLTPPQIEALPGLLAAQQPHGVRAVLLNQCPPQQAERLTNEIKTCTGLPVLGFLPPMAQAEFPSRHLGLQMASEYRDLTLRAGMLANELDKHWNWALFERLFTVPPPPAAEKQAFAGESVRVAVAQDDAFCFCYRETLEALALAGMKPVFFSPMQDAALPDGCSALYLPGGYPELHAAQLEQNEAMRKAVARAVNGGLPTIAECGGFLYLGQTLEQPDGTPRRMAGALPGQGFKTPKLVRFGYAALHPAADSMLFRQGESVPVHEFHHWDSTHNGTALHAVKPVSGKNWDCGFVSKTLYAGFPHLYLAGQPQLVQRFADCARSYARERKPE